MTEIEHTEEAAEPTILDPEVCADMVLALRYYAAPATYENVRILSDSYPGDFINDFADTRESYGQVARTVLAYVASELGVEVPTDGDAADRELMGRVGIDVERRYNPPPPSSDPEDEEYDADYDPERDDAEPCCNLRKAYVEGVIALEKGDDGLGVLPESCPMCGSAVDEESILSKPGLIKDYICDVTLHECGHYSAGFFSGADKCVYVRCVQEAQSGTDPLKVLERFEAEHTSGEGWGRVRFEYDEAKNLAIKVYRRVGYSAELPTEYEGFAVNIEQLD